MDCSVWSEDTSKTVKEWKGWSMRNCTFRERNQCLCGHDTGADVDGVKEADSGENPHLQSKGKCKASRTKQTKE